MRKGNEISIYKKCFSIESKRRRFLKCKGYLLLISVEILKCIDIYFIRNLLEIKTSSYISFLNNNENSDKN